MLIIKYFDESWRMIPNNQISNSGLTGSTKKIKTIFTGSDDGTNALKFQFLYLTINY